MNLAYVRVSSIDQNEERQINGLQKYNIDKWYTEKISAKNINRPQLQEMLEFARPGDTIYVLDFSRLARSTEDLLRLVRDMQDKGINMISSKENLDTGTNVGKMMLSMIAAINEFERDNLLERQREGIAIAKAKGKYKGRKPISFELSFFEEHYGRYLRRELSKVQFAKMLEVTRPTLDKIIKAQENIGGN